MLEELQDGLYSLGNTLKNEIGSLFEIERKGIFKFCINRKLKYKTKISCFLHKILEDFCYCINMVKNQQVIIEQHPGTDAVMFGRTVPPILEIKKNIPVINNHVLCLLITNCFIMH